MPETPLPSLEILKEDRDNWPEFHQNMGKALFEMRLPDKNLVIKPLPTVNNPLLERRMKKPKTDVNAQQTSAVAAATVSKTKNDLVVEDLTRENTMVAAQTPTNSRPSSPAKNTTL